MRSKLEERIQELSRDLSNRKPEEGHRERFEARLKQQSHPLPLRQSFFTWWKIAAVFVLMLAVAAFLLLDLAVNEMQALAMDLPDEIVEAEVYYTQQKEMKMKKLEALADDSTQAEEWQQMVSREIVELEKQQDQLKREYAETANERILLAIINNYRLISKSADRLIDGVSNEKSIKQ